MILKRRNKMKKVRKFLSKLESVYSRAFHTESKAATYGIIAVSTIIMVVSHVCAWMLSISVLKGIWTCLNIPKTR